MAARLVELAARPTFYEADSTASGLNRFNKGRALSERIKQGIK